MPQRVTRPGEIRPGDLFEDCRHHPCLCYDVGDRGDEDAVFGISLIDGSTWQCSITHCGVRKLTLAEAWQWKNEGPADVEFGPDGVPISHTAIPAVNSPAPNPDDTCESK
jgi:hypothetical protein